MFGEEDNDGSEADGSTDNYISSLSFDPDVSRSRDQFTLQFGY